MGIPSMMDENRIKEPRHKCEFCDYQSDFITNVRNHTMTYHASKEERRAAYAYYCDACDFGHYSRTAFEKHCQTSKHKKKTAFNATKQPTDPLLLQF
jgi:hypothetical protein